MSKRPPAPGWWTSQVIGREDPYDAWYPNVMVTYHAVTRTTEGKRKFRELCRRSADLYGMYYDLVPEDDRGVCTEWKTVFKLYAPITETSSHADLSDILVATLATKQTRLTPAWLAKWKRKWGKIRKVIQRDKL